MNKQLNQFLEGREKNPPYSERFSRCVHGPDMWCTNCVNFGQRVSVEIRPGVFSEGTIMTNDPEMTAKIFS